MDNVVTNLMIFEGNGHIDEFVGSYSDWQREGGSLAALEAASQLTQESTEQKAAEPATMQKSQQSKSGDNKQNHQAARERKKALDKQMRQIEKLEARQQELETLMGDADFYDKDQSEIDTVLKESGELQGKLEQAYADWEALEQSH
jgi:ATP-binding cassette subfamily F protein uup